MDAVLGKVIDDGIAGFFLEYMAQMALADSQGAGDGRDADVAVAVVFRDIIHGLQHVLALVPLGEAQHVLGGQGGLHLLPLPDPADGGHQFLIPEGF